MQEFKLIIAGGRDFNDYDELKIQLQQLLEALPDDLVVSIVTGMAKGADALGYRYAQDHIAVCYKFPADWDKYGKSAGFHRNEAMGKFADGLLAFWDGESRGTKHMIEFMEKLGKPVKLVPY